MALESPFGNNKGPGGTNPKGPKVNDESKSKAAAKGAAKGVAKKGASKALAAGAAAIGGPAAGQAAAAATESGTVESLASKIPAGSAKSIGREATNSEVADSIRKIKGATGKSGGKKTETSPFGDSSAVNGMASSPFEKSAPSKSLGDIASRKESDDDESTGGDQQTNGAQEEGREAPQANKPEEKKKSKNGLLTMLILGAVILVAAPILFIGGCAAMIAGIGGVGGGMVNFGQQQSDTCDTGDNRKASDPDLKGSDDQSSSLRDDVEGMGDGMEVKDDDVFLDSEEVKSPLNGKVEDATDDTVRIKSTRPGQNTEVTISGLKEVTAKKGRIVKAGDVIGKAKEKKKPSPDKKEKWVVQVKVKDDDKDKTAEEYFNKAATSETDDDTDTTSKENGSKAQYDEEPELGLTPEQVHNAKMVIAIGEQMDLGKNQITGALDVAQQESGLQNFGNNGTDAKSPMGGSGGTPVDGKYLAKSMKDPRVSPTADPGHDNNSTGIFQQQVVLKSDGQVAPESEQVWGTWKQSMDAGFAAYKFFEAYQKRFPDAAKNKNSPASSVYPVQGSADDSRPAAHNSKSQAMYDKWKGEGKKHPGLLDKASNGETTGTTTSDDDSDSDDCSEDNSTNTSGDKGGGLLEANEGTLAANIVKLVDGEMGKPYSQAAGLRSTLPEKNPSHHDCSSFVSWLYWHGAGIWMSEDGSGWGWHTGIFISRFHGKKEYHVTGKDYTEASSSAISPEKDLKPGDVINTSPNVPQDNGHVWLYIGNGEEAAAHGDGIPSSKSKPWTADAGGREFFIIRPLNAKDPDEIAGPRPENQKIPDKIMKLWKENKKW